MDTSTLTPARAVPPRGDRRAAPAGRPSDAGFWAALFGQPALSVAELEVLQALAQERRVARGGRIFGRGEVTHQLVALREGDVALGLQGAGGQFQGERIVRGPAWLELAAGWLGEPHALDAVAGTPVTVVDLPCEALQARFDDLPLLAQRVIGGLARQVQALAVQTQELMHKSAPARLAHWLQQQCEPLPGRDNEGTVRLQDRKRDLAAQLAITPETLSRLMRSFSRRGVIEVCGYTVRVLDVRALAALVDE